MKDNQPTNQPLETYGSFKAIIELLHEMRQSEKANRKMFEKRLQELEEDFIELKVKVKSWKPTK